MKFKIDVKAFIKMVMPVIEAAGSQPILRNAEDYLPIDGTLIKHCEGAIKSAISETIEIRDDKWSKKEVSKCCNDVSLAVRKKMFPLKRVTISAQYRKFEAIASEDSITARAALTRKNLEDAGYKCEQAGEFTVEPDYLRILFKNINNWKSVIIEKAKNNTVKVYPESEDGNMRQFSVFSYHVKQNVPGGAKKVGVVDKSILIRGFRIAVTAYEKVEINPIYKNILIHFSDSGIKVIAGNGKYFGLYSIVSKNLIFNEPAVILLNGEDIERIIESIAALQDGKVVIKVKQTDEQESIVFTQGGTHIAVRCKNTPEQYPPVAELFDYDYKYSFKTSLYNWINYVGKTITPACYLYPVVAIKADVENGCFLVKHRENMRYQTPIRFIYGSDTKYYDLSSINRDELIMVCSSWDIVKMCDSGTVKDIICIEFGIDKLPTSETDINKKRLPIVLQVKYPIRQFKKTETAEQLNLIFIKKYNLPKANLDYPTSGLEDVKTWFQKS